MKEEVQYRYDVDNFHRRNRVYRAISGLLTYDLLDIVRDTYPSGEDVAWMFTNQDNRPTKELWDDAAQCFNELEYSNLAPGHDTVQAPVALGDPHLGVLIYPGQLIDADLVRDGASASGYHRRLMDFYFCFYGFDTCARKKYTTSRSL
ncbi:hypothetical protein Bbelb_334170 [Branchiostoma belcheri]|nr:hypothetical protein Bbelb_334170 [Branchiostoma belcheri]